MLDPDSPEGRAAKRIYEQGLCHNCGKRQGTIVWGDALAMTHGGGTPRCEVCAYSAQLEHAWHRALALPKLVFLLLRAIARQS